ncbi:hypothetical protein AB4254_08925 [Vibrio breoganii]
MNVVAINEGRSLSARWLDQLIVNINKNPQTNPTSIIANSNLESAGLRVRVARNGRIVSQANVTELTNTPLLTQSAIEAAHDGIYARAYFPKYEVYKFALLPRLIDYSKHSIYWMLLLSLSISTALLFLFRLHSGTAWRKALESAITGNLDTKPILINKRDFEKMVALQRLTNERSENDHLKHKNDAIKLQRIIANSEKGLLEKEEKETKNLSVITALLRNIQIAASIHPDDINQHDLKQIHRNVELVLSQVNNTSSINRLDVYDLYKRLMASLSRCLPSEHFSVTTTTSMTCFVGAPLIEVTITRLIREAFKLDAVNASIQITSTNNSSLLISGSISTQLDSSSIKTNLSDLMELLHESGCTLEINHINPSKFSFAIEADALKANEFSISLKSDLHTYRFAQDLRFHLDLDDNTLSLTQDSLAQLNIYNTVDQADLADVIITDKGTACAVDKPTAHIQPHSLGDIHLQILKALRLIKEELHPKVPIISELIASVTTPPKKNTKALLICSNDSEIQPFLEENIINTTTIDDIELFKVNSTLNSINPEIIFITVEKLNASHDDNIIEVMQLLHNKNIPTFILNDTKLKISGRTLTQFCTLLNPVGRVIDLSCEAIERELQRQEQQ